LLEVEPDRLEDLRVNLFEVPWAVVGRVIAAPALRLRDGPHELARVALADAVHAFKHPLDFDGTLTEAGR
jgi:hypothetical protein